MSEAAWIQLEHARIGCAHAGSPHRSGNACRHRIAVQITLGAALAFAAAPRLVSDIVIRSRHAATRDAVRNAISMSVMCLIALSCVMATSRSTALIQYYGAPTQAWQVVSTLRAAALPAAGPDAAPGMAKRACVGAEWHRFSSSFFLPAGVELAFVEFGDTGVV